MDNRTFKQMAEAQVALENNIMTGKRHDYTAGNEDVLINFKSVAERTGLEPLQVWAVYFNKHIDSIMTFIKTGKQESGESLEGRIADARNYLLLLLAMVAEEEVKVVVPSFLDDLKEAPLIRQGTRPIITAGKEAVDVEQG